MIDGLNHEWLDAMNAQDSSVLNYIDIGINQDIKVTAILIARKLGSS